MRMDTIQSCTVSGDPSNNGSEAEGSSLAVGGDADGLEGGGEESEGSGSVGVESGGEGGG